MFIEGSQPGAYVWMECLAPSCNASWLPGWLFRVDIKFHGLGSSKFEFEQVTRFLRGLGRELLWRQAKKC